MAAASSGQRDFFACSLPMDGALSQLMMFRRQGPHSQEQRSPARSYALGGCWCRNFVHSSFLVAAIKAGNRDACCSGCLGTSCCGCFCLQPQVSSCLHKASCSRFRSSERDWKGSFSGRSAASLHNLDLQVISSLAVPSSMQQPKAQVQPRLCCRTGADVLGSPFHSHSTLRKSHCRSSTRL